MWYGDPFGERGWWGKDGNWYVSGWSEHWPCWTARPLYRGPKVVERYTLPMAHGPHFWTTMQHSAYHGAIPPEGFAPRGYRFSS